MRTKLEQIRREALEALGSADSRAALEALRVKYLGKKGALTAILKAMGALSAEERPVMGQLANIVRAAIDEALTARMEEADAREREAKLAGETIDVTMPGRGAYTGRIHPLNQIINEARRIFGGMGFECVDGPEIEFSYNNFDALNAPANHPSRDFQDTFYFSENVLLRTQTSPVQIRSMKERTPPIRIISPGRVYRNDDVDATHAPQFHQIEGLLVDRGVTMADLKGSLEVFAQAMFGAETRVRFRPHHFPFTEPSAEMDISCFACHGAGCRLCKGEGFIEILGCGMVHPNVLRAGGIDPEIYSGWAFGMGVERITMLRHKIDDLRLFSENDVRFLRQF